MVVCFSVAPPFCSEVSYEKTTISHDAIAMFNVVQATRFLCDLLIWYTTSKAEREKWRYPLEILQLRAWEYCDVYKMTKLFFENKALMGLNISVHSIIVLVFLKYLKLFGRLALTCSFVGHLMRSGRSLRSRKFQNVPIPNVSASPRFVKPRRRRKIVIMNSSYRVNILERCSWKIRPLK